MSTQNNFIAELTKELMKKNMPANIMAEVLVAAGGQQEQTCAIKSETSVFGISQSEINAYHQFLSKEAPLIYSGNSACDIPIKSETSAFEISQLEIHEEYKPPLLTEAPLIHSGNIACDIPIKSETSAFEISQLEINEEYKPPLLTEAPLIHSDNVASDIPIKCETSVPRVLKLVINADYQSPLSKQAPPIHSGNVAPDVPIKSETSASGILPLAANADYQPTMSKQAPPIHSGNVAPDVPIKSETSAQLATNADDQLRLPKQAPLIHSSNVASDVPIKSETSVSGILQLTADHQSRLSKQAHSNNIAAVPPTVSANTTPTSKAVVAATTPASGSQATTMSPSVQDKADASVVDSSAVSTPTSSTKCVAVLGNSSIHAVGVLPDYVWARSGPHATSGPSMLISVSLSDTQNSVWIEVPDLGFSVSSIVGRMDQYNDSNPETIDMVVMPALPAKSDYLATNITFTRPRPLCMLEAAVLKPFMTDDAVNMKAVDSELRPVLGYTDEAVAPQLAAAFTFNTTLYDNMAVYAKLWYAVLMNYAITRYELDVTDTVPPWNNMPADIFLNGDNPAEMARSLHSAIHQGRLVFVEGPHFNSFHLPIIYYLAAEGNPFAPGNGPGPYIPGQTVLWPAFPISLLWITQAPSVTPQPGLPGWARILRFINSLAKSRGEIDDCVRGFHFASDVVGSSSVWYRMPSSTGHRNCWVLVTPLHEAFGYLQLPRPCDFNVLLRLLHLAPALPPSDKKAEFNFLVSYGFGCIFKSVIVTSGIVSAMATTVFSSFNCSGALMQKHAFNVEIPAAFKVLKTSSFLHGELHDSDGVPVLFQLIFALVRDCCGFSRPLDYLWMRSWGCLSPSLAETWNPQDYGLAPGNSLKPFMLGNLLAVNDWLKLRPLEWGVSIPSPRCSLSTSLVQSGPQNERGWAAYLADDAYSERFSSDEPNRLSAYAAFAINIICQRFQHAFAPTLQWQLAGVKHCAGSVCFQAPSDFEPQPPYEASISTFWPCTLPTFHAEKEMLIAMRMSDRVFFACEADSYRRINSTCHELHQIPGTGLFLPDYKSTFLPTMSFWLTLYSRKRVASASSSSVSSSKKSTKMIKNQVNTSTSNSSAV